MQKKPTETVDSVVKQLVLRLDPVTQTARCCKVLNSGVMRVSS